VIEKFKHKGLKLFFDEGVKKKINPDHAEKLSDILDMLDAATEIKDMDFPGSRLHLLEPKNKGRYAVTVSKAWRITFRFEGGNAYDVDYENYH